MIATDQLTSALENLRIGETGAALALLGSTWKGIGKRPTDGPTQRQTAENLLLCGILTSRLGAERKNKGAQEQARDLLNEAYRLFTRLRDQRKHKAQIELALSYWRSGEINEAVAFIDGVHPIDKELAFEAALTKALFQTETGRLDSAATTLESVLEFADEMPSVLRGQFHQERAVVLRKKPVDGNLDRAILEYQAALFYYEHARCLKGEAMVRNNLASIYRDFSDYKQAHESAAKAISLFTRLNNQHLVAEAQDQEASIFFAEGNYVEAARLSRIAATALEHTDQRSMLGRTLVTLGRSLARLRRFDAAQETLERAAAIFEHTADPIGQANIALTLIEEVPLNTQTALENLALASRFVRDTHLAERFGNAASKLGIQLLSEGSSTYADIDQHADKIRSIVIARTLAKYGGVNAKGAIVRTAEELGISHSGLSWFFDQHKEFGRKKRPRSQILTFPKRKKSE